ncbi:MAG: hypothetical protein OXD49_02980 [Candidatus Poribacteria bacterium]|nr:hypothetical protein [Candidatus Poribacteria bacterium]
MKNNLRGKIRDFIASEEGRVSAKGPLTLGIATGSVLLAQTIVGTPDAQAWPCDEQRPCPPGYHCHMVGSCVKH